MSELSVPVAEDPEFIRLVEGFLENTLSEPEVRRLEELLNSDPAAIDECARRLKMHAELEETCDPVHLELRQDRRMLIEGRGDARRVLMRETQSAHLGNSRATTEFALPGPAASPAGRVRALALAIPALVAVLLIGIWIWQERKKDSPDSPGSDPQGGTTVSGPVWSRPPKSEAELKYWLTNMVEHHDYSLGEIQSATGLEEGEIRAALKRFAIKRPGKVGAVESGPLRIMPYPGGRHPRLAGLSQAINPQRETKVSVFTPWSRDDYVVVDLPEALRVDSQWLYLAHTDIPTVWTKMNIHLRPLEWTRHEDGRLEYQRELPDGSGFGATVQSGEGAVLMELWVHNGTLNPMKGVRGQVCVLTARVAGFEEIAESRAKQRKGYTYCRAADGKRWIITAWHRLGGQTVRGQFPCMHADPQLGDCGPGETVRAKGWLSFYEGEDVEAELDRIEATGWRGDEEGGASDSEA
jgi:hypothetical protein